MAKSKYMQDARVLVGIDISIFTVRAPNGRKAVNHRLVLDGVFWIARTGAPWRDLPGEFGKWSSVYRQFRRWTLAGLWEDIGGPEPKRIRAKCPADDRQHRDTRPPSGSER